MNLELPHTPFFATDPITRLPMDGREVPETTPEIMRGDPRDDADPPRTLPRRTLPCVEVLQFDPETKRGLANYNGALVVFEGTVRRYAEEVTDAEMARGNGTNGAATARG